jgi:hypothetical protein
MIVAINRYIERYTYKLSEFPKKLILTEVVGVTAVWTIKSMPS